MNKILSFCLILSTIGIAAEWNGTLALKKTGQTKSYDINGTEVSDGSFKDDGYYQAGIVGKYSRDDDLEIVTDEITGLMWQDDEAAATVSKQWLTQANYDDGNYSTTTGDTAATYCSELTLGDYDDWRLPTISELMYILDYGNKAYALDPVFVNVDTGLYWSSTDVVAVSGRAAWVSAMKRGNSSTWPNKDTKQHVRCVRGYYDRGKHYTRDPETGIVIDHFSDLEWQDNDVVAKNWEWALKYCDTLDLNGTGWRLPNMNELNFLVDRSKCFSAIDEIFTITNSDAYWTATTTADDHTLAWSVNFKCGRNFNSAKDENTFRNVRCVRTKKTLLPSSANALKKTGQAKSYDMNGTEVLDGSFKDDGYYQAGIVGKYSRDDVLQIVTDEITGLMWQDDEEAATVTKQWLTQANYDDGNYSTTTGDTAATYCSELTLGNYDDWRLPSISELMYILDYGNSDNALDPVFTYTAEGMYWSASSVIPTDNQAAWVITFPSGKSNYWATKTENRHIRCVRGRYQRGKHYTKDKERGIVTDHMTGLEWQDNEVVAKNWEWAVHYCNTLDLNGTDWRLPNMNELNFLADREKTSSAIANSVFGICNADAYWTATTVASDHHTVWAVNFRWGKTFTPAKNENTFYNVRCVRGGKLVSHPMIPNPALLMYILQ